MAIEFIPVPHDKLDQIPPIALKFLKDAHKRTPANTDKFEIVWDMAAKGYGRIYLIAEGSEVVGATYLISYTAEGGKVLSPLLVGGKNMRCWKREYQDWLCRLGNENGAIAIWHISRKGWRRFYPEYKIIGHVYEYRL